MELLSLNLDLLQGKLILLGHPRVQLFEDLEQQTCNVVFDLHGHCVRFRVHLRALHMLMVQVEVAEDAILLLKARPSVFNCLIHARKKLLDVGYQLEGSLLNLLLIQGLSEVSVSLDKFLEFIVDSLRLLDRYSLKESSDLVMSVLSSLLLFVIRRILFTLLGISQQKLALGIELIELARDCLFLLEVIFCGLVDVELSDFDLHQVNVGIHVGHLVAQVDQLARHVTKAFDEATADGQLVFFQKLAVVSDLVLECIVRGLHIGPDPVKLSDFSLVRDHLVLFALLKNLLARRLC